MEESNLATAWQLVLLILLIGGSIVTGYGARRTGFPELLARRLMYLVVLGPYTAVAFLALWDLELTGRYALLPLIGFVLMAIGAAVGVLLSRPLGLNRPQPGHWGGWDTLLNPRIRQVPSLP